MLDGGAGLKLFENLETFEWNRALESFEQFAACSGSNGP